MGHQEVKGDVCRTAIPEQKFVEQRAPGVVEDDKFAVEDKAWGQEIEHVLEPLHAVAVA